MSEMLPEIIWKRCSSKNSGRVSGVEWDVLCLQGYGEENSQKLGQMSMEH